MINSYSQALSGIMRRLNPNEPDDVPVWQFTGLVAGIALAVTDPQLAKELHTHLVREWIKAGNGRYESQTVADEVIRIIKEERGGNNNGL